MHLYPSNLLIFCMQTTLGISFVLHVHSQLWKVFKNWLQMWDSCYWYQFNLGHEWSCGWWQVWNNWYQWAVLASDVYFLTKKQQRASQCSSWFFWDFRWSYDWIFHLLTTCLRNIDVVFLRIHRFCWWRVSSDLPYVLKWWIPHADFGMMTG